MEKDLVKRMVKKDGSQRISFYRDEYADNPRDMTDEPLHCEDWSRDYSIMDKHERENKSEDARKLLEYLILTGDNCNREKFINALIDNGKKSGKSMLSSVAHLYMTGQDVVISSTRHHHTIGQQGLRTDGTRTSSMMARKMTSTCVLSSETYRTRLLIGVLRTALPTK